MWDYGLDRAVSRKGHLADCCKRGNKPSASIKCREFFYQMRTGQLLMKDSAPW